MHKLKLILGLCPTNLRRRYKATPSLRHWLVAGLESALINYTFHHTAPAENGLWIFRVLHLMCNFCRVDTLLYIRWMAKPLYLIINENSRVYSKMGILVFRSALTLPTTGISKWALNTFLVKHDDVIKWKHFPRYWPFVRGIQRSPVNSPHQDQWRGALVFFLICARINGWVNNRDAGDLRRCRAHYDVIVMGASPGVRRCHTAMSYQVSQSWQMWRKVYYPWLLP